MKNVRTVWLVIKSIISTDNSLLLQRKKLKYQDARVSLIRTIEIDRLYVFLLLTCSVRIEQSH